MKNLLKNNFFYIQKKSKMKILETVKTFVQEIDATVFLLQRNFYRLHATKVVIVVYCVICNLVRSPCKETCILWILKKSKWKELRIQFDNSKTSKESRIWGYRIVFPKRVQPTEKLSGSKCLSKWELTFKIKMSSHSVKYLLDIQIKHFLIFIEIFFFNFPYPPSGLDSGQFACKTLSCLKRSKTKR